MSRGQKVKTESNKLKLEMWVALFNMVSNWGHNSPAIKGNSMYLKLQCDYIQILKDRYTRIKGQQVKIFIGNKEIIILKVILSTA